MANICYNTIRISKTKEKNEILNFFRLDNKELEEVLCEWRQWNKSVR